VRLIEKFFEHFIHPTQLFNLSFDNGISLPSPVDGMSFGLGLPLLLTIVLLFGVVLKYRTRVHIAVLLLIVFLLFLTIPQSIFIWRALPILQYFQFPWRLLGLVTFFGALGAALVWSKLARVGKLLFLGAFLLQIALMIRSDFIQYIHHDTSYYRGFTETTTVEHENNPAWLKEEPRDLSLNKPQSDDENVTTFEVQKWTGSHHVYRAGVGKNSTVFVVEPTLYFPGWETRVNNKKVNYDVERAKGLIGYELHSGMFLIDTRFTQNTPARLIGNTTSAVSIVFFAVLLLWMRRRKA
jgi:hypothetical protein